MKRYIIFLLLSVTVFQSFASSEISDSAKSWYNQERYTEAAEAWEKLTIEGENTKSKSNDNKKPPCFQSGFYKKSK
jgi:hypothetical protein